MNAFTRPVEELVLALSRELGEQLRAAWVGGSIATGEVVPGWSDIDLRVVLDVCDFATHQSIGMITRRVAMEHRVKIGLHTMSMIEFTQEHKLLAQLRLAVEVEDLRREDMLIGADINMVDRREGAIVQSFAALGLVRARNRRLMVDETIGEAGSENGKKLIRSAATVVHLALRSKGVQCSRKLDLPLVAQRFFPFAEVSTLRDIIEYRSDWQDRPEHWLPVVEKAANYVEEFVGTFYRYEEEPIAFRQHM